MVKTFGRTQGQPIRRLHGAFGSTHLSVTAIILLLFYNDGGVVDVIGTFLLCRDVCPALGVSVLNGASVHGTLDIVSLVQDFWVRFNILLIISPKSYYMLFPVFAETSQQSISKASLYYWIGRSRGT